MQERKNNMTNKYKFYLMWIMAFVILIMIGTCKVARTEEILKNEINRMLEEINETIESFDMKKKGKELFDWQQPLAEPFKEFSKQKDLQKKEVSSYVKWLTKTKEVNQAGVFFSIDRDKDKKDPDEKDPDKSKMESYLAELNKLDREAQVESINLHYEGFEKQKKLLEKQRDFAIADAETTITDIENRNDIIEAIQNLHNIKMAQINKKEKMKAGIDYEY